MNVKKLFAHTAVYGLAPQVSKVAGFLALPLITSELTDVDYGVYGTITAYTAAISVFAVLGLRLILINSFYHYPMQHKWLWRQLYGFLNLWNIFYALLLGLVLFFVIPTEALNNKWAIIFLIIGPFIFFGQTATIGLTFYQLRQLPGQVALRSALSGLLTVCLNILFIVKFKQGYMGWFWANFISGILYNFSYWHPINIKYKLSPIYNFKWRLIKRSLKISFPIIPHHYSSFLVDGSDRVVMDLTNVPVSSIGKYNIAYSIGNMFNALGMAAGYAMGPLMNQMYKDKDDLGARNIVFTMQLTFFALSFIASIWLKEIFQIMVKNEELSKMYYLAVIIAMSYNYRPMYLGAVNKLFYQEETNSLWKLTLGAGLINLVLNFLLIPIFTYEIATVTTFLAFMYMGYAGYFSPKFKKFNKVNYYPLWWMSATIALTILAFIVVELSVIVKIMVTVIFSGVLVYGLFKLVGSKKHSQ